MELLEPATPVVLEPTPECRELAQVYIDTGILSEKKLEDATHVAICTVYELDVLVSWNHRHMANVRKTEQYRGANLIRGYWKPLLILTPLEVIHE